MRVVGRDVNSRVVELNFLQVRSPVPTVPFRVRETNHTQRISLVLIGLSGRAGWTGRTPVDWRRSHHAHAEIVQKEAALSDLNVSLSQPHRLRSPSSS